MFKIFKATYGSVWGWLGIIAGAIAVINLTVMSFAIGVAPVVQLVIETYRSWVYPIVEYGLEKFELVPPDWAKDLATLYLVLGLAQFRGYIQLVNTSPSFFNWAKLPLYIAMGIVWPGTVLMAVIFLFLGDDGAKWAGRNVLLYLWLNIVGVLAAAFTFLLATAGQAV